MYEMSDDQRHSCDHESGQSVLPVLFHLIDVSRPRAMPLSQQPKPAPTEPLGEAAVPAEIEMPLPTMAAAPPLEGNAPNRSGLDSISPALLPRPLVEAPHLAIVTLPSSDARPSPEALQLVMRDEAELNAAPKSTIEKSEPAVAEPHISSPTASHLVTPRSQSTSRRKPKTPASEDWFA